MNDAARLLQLQKLRAQRCRIAAIRQLAARETQASAKAATDRLFQDLDRLKTSNSQFVVKVLDRSRIISNPNARISGIAWQIKSHQNLIESTTMAADHAADDYARATDCVRGADHACKAARIAQNRLEERIEETLRTMRSLREIRSEDTISEMLQALPSHKKGAF